MYSINSKLSAGQTEVEQRGREGRRGSERCSRAHRSIGDKHMSNQPMMKPGNVGGPNLLVTNALLTLLRFNQPDTEIHYLLSQCPWEREEGMDGEREGDRGGRERDWLKYRSSALVYAFKLMADKI